MSNVSTNISIAFPEDARRAFLQLISEKPNTRRVSQHDKWTMVEWLTNPQKRPSSQEDFSRRNYVRRSFAWDEKGQMLVALDKSKGNHRVVVTTDNIINVVEKVHTQNGHAGWDATWKDVSTLYYGILRSDVIFLLKSCQVCVQNPTKRPKGSKQPTVPSTFDPVNIQSSHTNDVVDEDREEWQRPQPLAGSGPGGAESYGDGISEPAMQTEHTPSLEELMGYNRITSADEG
ncbi:hypothetical protein LTR70_010038 [Exophiala xenobiotica]|nr:hypothetical protein LTR70_010038 [Exophiala xenobiotica]